MSDFSSFISRSKQQAENEVSDMEESKRRLSRQRLIDDEREQERQAARVTNKNR